MQHYNITRKAVILTGIILLINETFRPYYSYAEFDHSPVIHSVFYNYFRMPGYAGAACV